MKTVISLMFGFFVVLVVAVPAEAQYNSRGGYGGSYGQRRPLPGGWGGGGYGGYGYYDPAYLQQMMSLPDGLVACQIDFASGGKVTSCHSVIKDISMIEAHGRDHADRNEILGTYHIEKGKPHFHSFDDTNRRLGTFGAGALGAGGGYIATAGTQNGWVRGGATVGGGLLAGWLASRKNHNNCLIIEPVARSISTDVRSPAPSQEQGIVQQPIAGPAANLGQGQFELSNETRVYVEAYDGETYIGRMAPGATLMVDPPKDRYRGFALVPTADGRLGKDELDREVSPSGWLFIEPTAARGR